MAKDMTEGKIPPMLIKFTIPLVLGNLFQLTYNAVDSIMVGKFVGKEALAAVGTANPLMNVAILFISGMCMGASILMSNQYGAKDYETLEKQMSTTMLGGLIFSLIVSVMVFLFTYPLLSLIRVPTEIQKEAAGYLRIICVGLAFTFLYNFYANTLRALGDSKTPLYFLSMSAVFNVFGDWLLVKVWNMGVNGSAVSTVCSEALCCLCCGIYIKKKVAILQLGKKWFVFDKKLFKTTVNYAGTSAFQQGCLQIGKLLMQTIVNPMGVNMIAAFNVVNRIDDFAFTPEQNIGHAMTTMIAQCKGAGKKERIKKSFFYGIMIEIAYGLCLFVFIFFGAEHIAAFFVDENGAQVAQLCTQYMKLIAFLYIIPGITNGVQGYFRGMGDLKVTLLSTFFNMFGRVVFAWLFAASIGIEGLAWANLAGWVVMMAVELPLLVKSLKQMKVRKFVLFGGGDL